MHDLIPTTEEQNGMQRFIYRSIFPITFYVAETARYLDVICTVDYLRQEETVTLLHVFGFVPGKEITGERSGAHIMFSQKLFTVEVALDAEALNMIQCKRPPLALPGGEDTDEMEGDSDILFGFLVSGICIAYKNAGPVSRKIFNVVC